MAEPLNCGLTADTRTGYGHGRARAPGGYRELPGPAALAGGQPRRRHARPVAVAGALSQVAVVGHPAQRQDARQRRGRGDLPPPCESRPAPGGGRPPPGAAAARRPTPAARTGASPDDSASLSHQESLITARGGGG